MMGVRAQQKEKTRRSLVEAAFSQLSAERSFASHEKFNLFKKYIFVESPEKLMDMVMKYNDDYKMLVNTRKAATE
ncbi:hypothetical protein MJI47_29130, partial [Salmonella enterica subsp. enterica serovar Kentucky]|nr:hypothetical protein [Salmonella enterica subsp. enterica serovar Kentucky]